MLSNTKRLLLIFLGLLFLGLGFVGMILPGLPTTVFWIVAAYCFLKSSDRLYKRVISHPKYGEGVRMVVEEKKMTPRGKRVSLISMWSMMSLSALLLLFTGRWIISLIILGSGALGSLVILALKTEKSAEVLNPGEPI